MTVKKLFRNLFIHFVRATEFIKTEFLPKNELRMMMHHREVFLRFQKTMLPFQSLNLLVQTKKTSSKKVTSSSFLEFMFPPLKITEKKICELWQRRMWNVCIQRIFSYEYSNFLSIFSLVLVDEERKKTSNGWKNYKNLVLWLIKQERGWEKLSANGFENTYKWILNEIFCSCTCCVADLCVKLAVK